LGILTPPGKVEVYKPVRELKFDHERLTPTGHRELITIGEGVPQAHIHTPDNTLTPQHGNQPVGQYDRDLDHSSTSTEADSEHTSNSHIDSDEDDYTAENDLNDNREHNLHEINQQVILQPRIQIVHEDDENLEQDNPQRNDFNVIQAGNINLQLPPPLNMAQQQNPIDRAGVILELQGADPVARQAAIVQLGQFVQQINQPPPAQQPPNRMTLRQALEQAREGAAGELKVTDLMPDPWGSTKDCDPESHCVKFENYAAMHGYDDDPTKIAWFQATLKGEALNWMTTENNYATWEDLRRAFIVEFENQPSRNVAITNFRNLTWNGSERASSYLQRLKKSARLINANEEEVMVQFQIGLPKAVKLFFGATNPQTLREMTQTLQKYLELHGPVAVNSLGANEALTTIAEVLTGGMANPFVQHPIYTRQYHQQPQLHMMQTPNHMGYSSKNESGLYPIAMEQDDTKEKQLRHYGNEKRVRFNDRTDKYKPHDKEYRSRAYESSGESGTSNGESADESPKENRNTSNRHQRSHRRYDNKHKDNARDSSRENRHQDTREHNYAQPTVSDEMAKLMPMITAMAGLSRGRSPSRERANQTWQNNDSNTYKRPYQQMPYQDNGRRQTDFQGNGNNRPRNNQTTGRPKIPPGDGNCYYCNNYGHYKDECRKRLRYQSQGFSNQGRPINNNQTRQPYKPDTQNFE
jgi:hypothetical protein